MKTKDYMYCALMASIICLSAVFTIPIPFTPVPITLQVAAVCISGALLGSKRGLVSVIVYVLIGMVGLPVFSGFHSGPGVLMSPTGGFIIGFFPASYVVGLLSEKWIKLSESQNILYFKLSISFVAGLILIYIFGTIQLMIVAGLGFQSALFSAVVPFIPLDIFKICVGVVVSCFVMKNNRIISI